jgi:hypothetical protein
MQCRRDGEEAGTNYRVPEVRKGIRGATMLHTCFCISPYHYYLSIVQIKPFTPSPSHSAIEKPVFPSECKYFSPVHLYWGAQKTFCHWGPNPFSAALCIYLQNLLSGWRTGRSNVINAGVILKTSNNETFNIPSNCNCSVLTLWTCIIFPSSYIK